MSEVYRLIESQKKNSDYQACEYYPKWTCSKKVKAWNCALCKKQIIKIEAQIEMAHKVRTIGDKIK
jgi:hypothetical protein